VVGVDRIHLSLDTVQCQDTCACDIESLGYKRLSQVAKQLSASGGLLHGVCTVNNRPIIHILTRWSNNICEEHGDSNQQNQWEL